MYVYEKYNPIEALARRTGEVNQSMQVSRLSLSRLFASQAAANAQQVDPDIEQVDPDIAARRKRVKGNLTLMYPTASDVDLEQAVDQHLANGWAGE